MTAPERRPAQHTVTPYIAPSDARAAIAWYGEVFGAEPLGDPWIGEDGRVGHAEIVIGDSVLMISDEHPEIDVLGPTSRGGTTVTLHVEVEDADRVVDEAVAAGARLERPVRGEPYGRIGVVHDPWGYRWMVSSSPTTTGEPSA